MGSDPPPPALIGGRNVQIRAGAAGSRGGSRTPTLPLGEPQEAPGVGGVRAAQGRNRSHPEHTGTGYTRTQRQTGTRVGIPITREWAPWPTGTRCAHTHATHNTHKHHTHPKHSHTHPPTHGCSPAHAHALAHSLTHAHSHAPACTHPRSGRHAGHAYAFYCPRTSQTSTHPRPRPAPLGPPSAVPVSPRGPHKFHARRLGMARPGTAPWGGPGTKGSVRGDTITPRTAPGQRPGVRSGSLQGFIRRSPILPL